MAMPGLLPANLSQLFHLPKPPISSSPLASGPLQKKKPFFLSWQLPFAPSPKNPPPPMLFFFFPAHSPVFSSHLAATMQPTWAWSEEQQKNNNNSPPESSSPRVGVYNMVGSR